ncbi:delta-aminolevulinic acid dehydratase [Marinifilum caeruleilacunae]|uniref:Delta-aminolevulinic acid dehydratase n=1 Tax=Marinifilum caeruleilacunae TaxID=2499076 RepID=A0ABX1WTF9_9BACT|nr:delta-aminolevulinic acid dehydratase [Marinifilum caeruleilacunae]NOU59286.1 delta-aminolevulinic acid dehydratase [Marinifilum caeruleilacunae]
MIEQSLEQLREYIEGQEYKGWDPYDGLNSKLFQSIPFLNKSRLMRLIWIQAFKRNPINFRDLTGIKKAYNPKGLGLFLSGYCKLYHIDRTQEVRSRILFLSKKILELQSSGWSGACWGYNFDWQARAFFQPKGTPSVVVTSYVVNALLDAYEVLGDKELLRVAISSKDFILNDLHRTYDGNGDFCFSYSPLDQTRVFNASLLGSKTLARIYSITKEESLAEEAKRSVQFSVNYQNADGSWAYGTLPYHQWIDNFHTGFNLEAMADYQRYTGDETFNKAIVKGLEYYLNHFFTDEGVPKYYNNTIYPVDIHCPAQLPITLSKLNVFSQNLELMERVLGWTISNLQSPEGYFYFQAGKRMKIKIPYIRWAQAWMFLALSTHISETIKLNTTKNIDTASIVL